MKTCVGCKFFDPPAYGFPAYCTRNDKKTVVPDLVYGGTKVITHSGLRILRPATERSKRFFGCGPNAKFHEPK